MIYVFLDKFTIKRSVGIVRSVVTEINSNREAVFCVLIYGTRVLRLLTKQMVPTLLYFQFH